METTLIFYLISLIHPVLLLRLKVVILCIFQRFQVIFLIFSRQDTSILFLIEFCSLFLIVILIHSVVCLIPYSKTFHKLSFKSFFDSATSVETPKARMGLYLDSCIFLLSYQIVQLFIDIIVIKRLTIVIIIQIPKNIDHNIFLTSSVLLI